MEKTQLPQPEPAPVAVQTDDTDRAPSATAARTALSETTLQWQTIIDGLPS